MPCLSVFRGTSGPSPGKVVPSTAPSLPLLSAASLPLPLQPQSCNRSTPPCHVGSLRPVLSFGLNSLQIAHFESATCFPPVPASCRHLWREVRPSPIDMSGVCLPLRPHYHAQ